MRRPETVLILCLIVGLLAWRGLRNNTRPPEVLLGKARTPL